MTRSKQANVPSKELHLFSRKKECNNILHEWQESFVDNPKKGQYFLSFEDKKQQVIKLTYTKGGSWLPFIGFTNLLCARFTRMTTGHAPIGDSSSISQLAARVVKLKFKPANTL